MTRATIDMQSSERGLKGCPRLGNLSVAMSLEMVKTEGRLITYQTAVKYFSASKDARATIDRGDKSLRSRLRAVAMRISSSDGAELDRRQVPWRVIRVIPQGPDPVRWAERLAAALARYPAPA